MKKQKTERLINVKRTRKYALGKAKEIRGGRFTRCSKRFLNAIEGQLAAMIVQRIHQLPSVGKTLMAVLLLISACSVPVNAAIIGYDLDDDTKLWVDNESDERHVCYEVQGGTICS